MVFLALSLFGGWDTGFQQYPIIGIGIWTGLMYILYLTPKGDQMSTRMVFFLWSWFMFVGIGISMILAFVYAVSDNNAIWPLFPALGAFSVALVSTVILIISNKKHGKPSEKVES